MLVSSIYEQVAAVTGLCNQTLNFQYLSRAIELLSNEGLFDPQIGYLVFNNTETNLVTLPREVKTVLRVNINSTPTFFRNRLFEFTLNTNGSGDGEELGFAWSDRGYIPIQDERRLPGRLCYLCEDPEDIGSVISIYGRDAEGTEIVEDLVAASAKTYGTLIFTQVERVIRPQTKGICFLFSDKDETPAVAQYYPTETDPMYRVIKLSKAVASVRIMFRREVFEVTALTDVIPLHSKMAVIHATKAVKYMADDEYEKGDAALVRAVDFIKKEQTSRDEQDAMAGALESPSIIDASINVRDSIVVADVYDVACQIFGFMGRPKIFDRITMAMEVLRNKAQWDASLGVVDIWLPDRSQEVNVRQGKGSGYFVLPRFVEAIVSLNFCGEPSIARNRWFEFHLNGTGETSRASHGTWDDAGETCIITRLPLDPDTRRAIPVQVQAVAANDLDNGKAITLYGRERLADGATAEVYRDGKPGFTLLTGADIEEADPKWTEISRISREATAGFVQLLTPSNTLLGYYYPDETEPTYRAIRVEAAKSTRIRVLYRKRTPKVTSLFQPIPLRSRLAIENMLRALKTQESDPQTAAMFEQLAVNYLSEERINSTPSDSGSLQFDSSTMPGFTGNVS